MLCEVSLVIGSGNMCFHSFDDDYEENMLMVMLM